MRPPRSEFLCGMLLGAGLLGGGLFLGGAGADDAASPAPEIPVALRAQRFEVVDEVGTVRLVVGANQDGGSISVRDRFGRTVLLMGATADGGMLAARHADGQPAMTAGATSGGGAVRVHDRQGARVFDVLGRAHGGRVTIARGSEAAGGEVGRTALRFEVDDLGRGSMSAFGSGGRFLGLFADAAGAGTIETYDALERPLVSVGSAIGTHGQVKTFGATGEPLVMLTGTADDDGQIYTFDGRGQPLVAIASRRDGPTLRIFNREGSAAVSIETDPGGAGKVGVWKPDGEGRSFTP